MNTTKKILLTLVILLVLIQFIRPARNINPDTTARFIQQYHVPAPVAQSLKASCYDCHSNNTRYPWYANVQPVAWYLAHHVNEGKHELNFDEFSSYPLKKQVHKLKEVKETVEEGAMPLSSYTLIHTDAKLDTTEKKLIVDWASHLLDSLSLK